MLPSSASASAPDNRSAEGLGKHRVGPELLPREAAAEHRDSRSRTAAQTYDQLRGRAASRAGARRRSHRRPWNATASGRRTARPGRRTGRWGRHRTARTGSFADFSKWLAARGPKSPQRRPWLAPGHRRRSPGRALARSGPGRGAGGGRQAALAPSGRPAARRAVGPARSPGVPLGHDGRQGCVGTIRGSLMSGARIDRSDRSDPPTPKQGAGVTGHPPAWPSPGLRAVARRR